LNDPSLSGKDIYLQRYLPAFYDAVKRLEKKDVKLTLHGMPSGGVVVSDGEEWDVIAVVTYPSFKVFRDIVESREYIEEADHHRLACAADHKLVSTVEL